MGLPERLKVMFSFGFQPLHAKTSVVITRFFIALCLALAAPALVAEQAAPSPLLQMGDCQLAYDPVSQAERESLAFKTCVRGRGGVEINFVSGTPEENGWLKFGELQGGVFITRWLAWQGRGYMQSYEPLKEKTGPLDEGTEPYFDRSRRYSVIQIGNPAIDRIRLTGGLANLPFGIDRTDTVEFYRRRVHRGFWQSPEQAVWLTIDNQVNYQLDVGVATDVIEHQGQDDGDVTATDASSPTPEEQDVDDGVRAFAARFMVDFSALDGSRVIASAYGEEAGRRRFGLGFVTVSRSDDLTQFEFVRALAAPDGGGVAFEQLLRLGYVAAWRQSTRWVVQIDDERNRARTGSVGFDALFYDHVIVRLAISHIKSESGDKLRRWFVTSGLEVTL